MFVHSAVWSSRSTQHVMPEWCPKNLITRWSKSTCHPLLCSDQDSSGLSCQCPHLALTLQLSDFQRSVGAVFSFESSSCGAFAAVLMALMGSQSEKRKTSSCWIAWICSICQCSSHRSEQTTRYGDMTTVSSISNLHARAISSCIIYTWLEHVGPNQIRLSTGIIYVTYSHICVRI